MRRFLFSMALVCSLALTGTVLADDDDDLGVLRQAICCGRACVIDGDCMCPGTVNPLNPCQVCDPDQSQAAWSVASECTDAGTPPVDAGTTPVTDAGTTPETDAGTTPVVDAGTTPRPDAGGGGGGGGGCTVAAQGSSGMALLVAALGLVALVRRRR